LLKVKTNIHQFKKDVLNKYYSLNQDSSLYEGIKPDEMDKIINKVEPVDTKFAMNLLEVMKSMKNNKGNRKKFKLLIEKYRVLC
jgi:hypothetical protein